MSETTNPVPVPSPEVPRPRSSRKRVVIGVVVVLIVLALLLPISNLFISPPSGTPLTRLAAASPEHLQAASVLEGNCLDCHSKEVKLPLYASLPVAASLLRRDREDGLAYMDMFSALAPSDGQPVGEVALAKLEYVLEHGTMPPARYVLLHWNRGVDADERGSIVRWVRGVRKQHYAAPDLPEAVQTDALRPLPTTMPADAKAVALGNKLFHDVRLSGDNTVSCASCHALDKGGTDQHKTSDGIGGAVGPINSPTVYNAVFNVKQFWDGRAADLQEQAGGPVENPLEMGAKFEQVVEKLNGDAALAAEFKAIYPQGISKESITHAIAEFEKTLVTPNCRFDQYLLGKADALTGEEIEGLQLFRANACGTCHAGPAMGGRSFERMGRRADYFADRGNLTPADDGRYSVTRDERDRHSFKVPTLRNIALTFPYFHDGSQNTLEGAVQAMARYQGYRAFSDAETARVVAFLKTLTGEYGGKMLGL